MATGQMERLVEQSRVASPMSLPAVIHAGFAKCGSTFLQAFMRNHPQLNYVFKACFYSPLEKSGFSKGLDEYSKRFRQESEDCIALESDEHLLMPLFHPVLGVRSVTRDSVEEVCSRIVRTLPEVKILLVIRNQLEMMVSTYSQYLLGGGTLTLDDFAQEFLSCSLRDQNFFAFFYDEIIQTVESHFPGRLKVVLAEEMALNTEEQLRDICQFIGIRYVDFQSTFRDRRIGLSRYGMRFVRALNRLVVRRHATRYQPEIWLPHSTYKFICNAARVIEHYCGLRWLASTRRRELASPQLMQLMRTTFSDSNDRLARWLGKDLAQWGYYTSGSQYIASPVHHMPVIATAKTVSS